MTLILPDVHYLTRADWGADTSLPRKGYTTDRNSVDIYLRKTDVILHHSVSVSRLGHPDIWENLAEIKVHARHMQVVRPDLGLDWPYNHGCYLMPDGAICVVEGRGYNRTGAHTKWHNTVGWGFVLVGNFEAAPFVNLDPWMPAINRYLAHVRRTELPNLIEITTHRKVGQTEPAARRYNTACPGRDVLARIHQFTLEDNMSQELDARMKQAAVIAAVFAKALAGAPLTNIEKSLSLAVIQAMEVKD